MVAAQVVVKKVFRCLKCDKCYTSKANLILHGRTRHGSDESRAMYPVSSQTFDCDQCDRKFLRSNFLTNHKKTHAPKKTVYACSECDDMFEQKEHLKEHHMEKHTIPETSQCDISTEN